MNWFLIQLQNYATSFQIVLAGVSYQMTVYWNDAPDGGWEFDLGDPATGLEIAAGLPFITGADCLAGLGYLGIGGSLYIYTNGMPDAVPTYDNLGIDSNLYFVVST
jgi:hypothetical protein